MDTLLLAGLACTVALLLITIRYYERRVERLQDDLDFAVRLLPTAPPPPPPPPGRRRMNASDTRRAELRVVNIAVRLCEALDQGDDVDTLLDEYRAHRARLAEAVKA